MSNGHTDCSKTTSARNEHPRKRIMADFISLYPGLGPETTQAAIQDLSRRGMHAGFDPQAGEELPRRLAHRKLQRSHVDPSHPEPRCPRRRKGQPVSALLKKTQGERLRLIATRSRAMAADDVRNLLLERLGLIARIGDVRPHPLRGHSVIAWTITDDGRVALSEIGSVTPIGADARSDRRRAP